MRERLDLGVGLMWFAGMDPIWSQIDDLVEVIEVEPQTLWVETLDPAAPWRPDTSVMDDLAGRPQPLIAHGVGFPVGGVRPPRAEGVSLFSESARRLDAVMASEHLAFNEVEIDGRIVNAGYLLPPRQTASGGACRGAAHRPVPIYAGRAVPRGDGRELHALGRRRAVRRPVRGADR